MAELADIINFLKDKTGCSNIDANSDITEDLGVHGDDFFDLITEFSVSFKVDITPCLWYFHSAEEGSWNSIGGIFFKSPDKRVMHTPVTPLMLLHFADRGKWAINYPVHKVPKSRYDILIDQLVIAAFMIFLIYKCSSS